jgi:putative peptide zinc metalloprotease protein
LWFISQEYLIFGAVMAIVFTFAWILVPMFKSLSYLWTGQDLANNRTRAVLLSGLMVAAIVAFLALVPFPQNFRANAVVRADPYARVFTTTEGWLHQVLVPSGTMVKAGQALLVMRNEELDAKLRLIQAQRAEASAQARVSFEENPALYQSMKTYFRALDASREKVLAEQQDLTLRAPCDGRWLAPDLTLRQGEAIPRGLELGVVQGEGDFFISAVVKQEDVSRLFTPEQVQQTEVKLRGLADHTLDVSDFSAIPAERESLPSAALGILGGGVTAVESSRPNNRQLPGTGLVESQEGKGTRPTEPVFEIRATLKPEDGVRLLHGQLAVARMSLPAEPLLSQWTRQLQQLFQKGYKI